MVWASLWVAIAIPCQATAALKESEQAVANFSFANQLGSGVYSVAGRSVQIYRLPLDWQLSAPDEDKIGVKLHLPLTVGFFDFRTADVLTLGLPRRIDTLSAVPGIELSRLFPGDWRGAVFGEAGVARDHSSTSTNIVYSGGVRALRRFPMAQWRGRYFAELVYAAAEYRDRSNDSMTRLVSGLEFRHALETQLLGANLDVGPYALNEWYLSRPAPPLAGAGARMSPMQFEIGITLGTERTVRLWKIPLPRIGLGLRFARDLSVVRFVIGEPF